jgi:phenylpropionate dioxygenase-like ring-hydroxylating dioxygenase large terminal subunit
MMIYFFIPVYCIIYLYKEMFLPSLGFILPGLFYPIAENSVTLQPQQVWLGGLPYILYRGPNGVPIVHSDVCPHLGASLTHGYVDKDGAVCCKYHGFRFKEGRFCGIVGTTTAKRGGKTVLTVLPVLRDRYSTYVAPSGFNNISMLPYQPPEEYDTNFVAIHGFRDLDLPQAMITENILDSSHISHVHRFGNPSNPLPRSIKFKRLDDFSGQTSFQYIPRPGSLSSLLVGRPNVIVDVENEYHLPTTTITRVRVAGKYVKTVLTRAQPISDTKTRLYYVVYRNFWTNFLMNAFISLLMSITLDEDVRILKAVHKVPPKDPIYVIHDVTFLKYREAIQNMTRQHQFESP